MALVWASVVVVHWPSCSAMRGISLEWELNPGPLHWQADSCTGPLEPSNRISGEVSEVYQTLSAQYINLAPSMSLLPTPFRKLNRALPVQLFPDVSTSGHTVPGPSFSLGSGRGSYKLSELQWMWGHWVTLGLVTHDMGNLENLSEMPRERSSGEKDRKERTIY